MPSLVWVTLPETLVTWCPWTTKPPYWPFAEYVAPDTTTHPSLMTARELAEDAQKKVADEAAKLVEEVQRREAEGQATQEQLDAYHAKTKELYLKAALESGESPAAAAEKAQDAADVSTAVVRSFIETAAKDFGKKVQDVFPELPVAVAEGDNQGAGGVGPTTTNVVPKAPTFASLDEYLQKALPSEDANRQAVYVDDVSGVSTKQAWDETPRTPGTVVGVVSVPDVKAINDNPLGSHDATNRLLRTLAQVRVHGERHGSRDVISADE